MTRFALAFALLACTSLAAHAGSFAGTTGGASAAGSSASSGSTSGNDKVVAEAREFAAMPRVELRAAGLLIEHEQMSRHLGDFLRQVARS